MSSLTILKKLVISLVEAIIISAILSIVPLLSGLPDLLNSMLISGGQFSKGGLQLVMEVVKGSGIFSFWWIIPAGIIGLAYLLMKRASESTNNYPVQISYHDVRGDLKKQKSSKNKHSKK